MTVLVWRWRTCADPNRPTPKQCEALGIPRLPNIAHPLASRFGERCTLIAQGRNGNRLVEFEDGYQVVAPLYATRAAG